MSDSQSLLGAARAFREVLASFDPAVVSVEDAGRVVDELARTEKVCAAARVRASARVTEVEGTRAIQRIAIQRGESAGKVRREIETIQAATEIPALGEALERGDVSLAQGAEIAKTEAEVPGSAQELIETAKKRGYAGVQDEGRRRRQAAMDETVLQERRRQARGVTCRLDELGMSEFTVRLLPEVGERLRARLEHQAQRRWRDGDRDSTPTQRLADALIDLLDTNTTGTGRGRTEVVVVAHMDALARGTALPDEPCHLVGGPRLPVEVVKGMARDALVSVVLDDGVNVDTIARYSRTLPAALRLLLEVGEPPDYLEAVCTDCHNRYRLQIDHIDPYANGGLTELSNLARRCPPCHTLKTEHDRQAGLLGPSLKPVTHPSDRQPVGVGGTTGRTARGASPP